LCELRIVALDAHKRPAAEMTAEVELHGCRYIEDRDTTAVVSGSRHTPRTFRESWRLTATTRSPWRIASAA
jgi:predicted lipid-binding transport protein (Tim44 family)